MNRAEMRRMKREREKAHTVTYNLTQAQLDAIVQEKNVSEIVRDGIKSEYRKLMKWD